MLKELKLPINDDPLCFWNSENGKKFPKIQLVAPHVLSVPASTASVERFFSKCGLSCIGRRDRLCGKNLETKF